MNKIKISIRIFFVKLSCMTLFLTLTAFASENCSMLGGTCKDSCYGNEGEEQGAFIDCESDQECCVDSQDPGEIASKCCIYSFNSIHFSKSNCGIPKDSICETGTSSPNECSELIYCRDR